MRNIKGTEISAGNYLINKKGKIVFIDADDINYIQMCNIIPHEIHGYSKIKVTEDLIKNQKIFKFDKKTEMYNIQLTPCTRLHVAFKNGNGYIFKSNIIDYSERFCLFDHDTIGVLYLHTLQNCFQIFSGNSLLLDQSKLK